MTPDARAVVVLAGLALASCRCASAAPAPRGTEDTEPGARLAARHGDGTAPSSAADAASPVGDGAMSPPDAAPPASAALEAEGELVALAVPGFRDAVVSVPLGARERRPVVVALHGNYDRPEWQCEVWRGITGAHPFILCPRGIPRDDAPKAEDRWHYGGLEATRKELDAGLAALRVAFPEHVDPGPVVFTGFSLGAILGGHLVRKDPARFSRVVLVEGGAGGWGMGFAKKVVETGTVRFVFGCGQAACREEARAPVRVLEKAGVGARIAYGGNVGHTYDGAVARAIAREWAWLVEGDPRWPSGDVAPPP